MPENYILLERTELNASAASVSFLNIPQTGYTDLKIVASARTTSSNTVEGSTITFNGSSTYSTRFLQGDGSSATSGTQTILNALLFNAATSTANTFGNSEMYIPNYTGSNQKSVSGDGVNENNATQGFAGMFAGLSTLTSAITTITIAGNASGSFVAGSTFSLYGIAALGTTPVIAPKAIGGNRIDNDGTYWYHTFTSSGSFTPLQGISCEVLMVAGGGGGGVGLAGGGGAGGQLYLSGQSLASATSYAVAIGAGGAGAASGNGTVGQNTTLGALTAAVGGGFGACNPSDGGPGGSGGGARGFGGKVGGTGTVGQGNNGGTSTNGAGSGGGGAGAAGQGLTTGANGGNGGAGSSTYSSWFSVVNLASTVAGGGGGGCIDSNTAGTANGGGGAGSNSSNNATAGTVSTGGGGGGSGYNSGSTVSGSSGAGGSGFAIIRYPIA
jgi:hypothetical protein